MIYAHMFKGLLKVVCGEEFGEASVYRHCELNYGNKTSPALYLDVKERRINKVTSSKYWTLSRCALIAL